MKQTRTIRRLATSGVLALAMAGVMLAHTSAAQAQPMESHTKVAAAAVNLTVRAYYPYNTLSSIGAKLCGSWTAWYGIYADNRARIGPNPDLIYPGTVLYVRCATVPAAAPVVRSSLSTGWVHPLPYALGRWPGACWLAPRGDHLHKGVDLIKPWGTPVRAAHRGRVDRVGWNGGYGKTVELNHSGVMTRYAHLSKYAVQKGQWVRAGQTIAFVGSTGDSTGPHLHFEVGTQVWISGSQINPAPYMRARGVNIGC